ncbi:MAG: tRNA (guanosine(37)-N1)-methyltransferase TrmD [Fimbriimonadaceae bacterium]|nr:tRNA (guanosine(37)-N1)-methyltransferase TrmD [Fimbriimonadaceae bacterium]QYK55474.1 MAG: tRNA (guanosine(37)-N1)-methyltransferase TrmD [Fimbriimonadaceae bacterium]
MQCHFVTLFPEMVMGAVSHSILARAQAANLASFHTTNPRDFATDKHRSVDDEPYGGGPGMVMMASTIAAAVDSLALPEGTPVVLLDPAAPLFTQRDAVRLSRHSQIVLVCGHYEGVDERVRTQIATEAFSIGDFVLTGGELPALMVADAIVRLLPGVLGDPASHEDDSHSDGLLGFPLYTRPLEFRGEKVPAVLTSGHHGEIAKWRRQQSLIRTRVLRPDLFCKAGLTKGDVDLLYSEPAHSESLQSGEGAMSHE